jgi:two-component system, OmpR family, sensor histidine kinase SenX3
MVVPGRHRSIAFFIALGVGLISVILLLYIGWVIEKWHTGILFFFGILLMSIIVAGIVLNTTFLVREVRRNEQHDAFINAVTHELKTPVASIRLYLETLQTRAVDEQKRQEFYSIMLDDSERLVASIEQILRAGRAGVARRLVHFAPVDLDRVIEQSLARARALHNLEAVALAYQKLSGVQVLGDEDELRAAISNLVDNAVKYSGTAAQVQVETKVEGKFVSVSVKDNGMGIPSGELRRIFKRFYRVGGGSARAKGTGLGLFIVRSVAKRHGGSAWAESDGLGRGSKFTLQLPISK